MESWDRDKYRGKDSVALRIEDLPRTFQERNFIDARRIGTNEKSFFQSNNETLTFKMEFRISFVSKYIVYYR